MRLGRAVLGGLRRDRGSATEFPDEQLLDLPETIVQFGTGALLRGLIDDSVHRANQRGTYGGRIVAIASTGSARDQAVREQDGLFTLVVEGIDKGQRVEDVRVVSSLSRAISAADDWDAVLAVARQEQLQFVFSNTTEVGIADDNVSRFDDRPPKSFPAKLARFLAERARTFDYDPRCGLVVIPCELIEDNGERLASIVLAIASRWKLDERFMRWLEDAVPFCNTLVDRIVPGAPRGEHAAYLSGKLGYDDALLTTCEPYRLLAIEASGKVAAALTWAAADEGIVVSPDIGPYRTRKVHLLNGPHSVMAYVAIPMPCETVRDAITHPAVYQLVRHAMMEEIAPVLDVDGAEEFAEAVLDRFQNPYIRHALIDITLQATMKMRVRVVPIILRHAERRGAVPQSLAFGFAAYLLFMEGKIQEGRRARGLEVPADDQGSRVHEHWSNAGSSVRTLVQAACGDVALWGTDLSAIHGFADSVADSLQRMRTEGMAAALEHHVGALASPA